MASSGDTEPNVGGRLSTVAKLVMLTETVFIFFLSFWLYEEWLSNPFMQTYASDLIQMEGRTIAIIASLGVVAGLGTGVLWMRRKSSSLWDRTVGTVVPTLTALSTGVKQATETFHPAVAALKAAISGTGTISQTVQPPGTVETPVPHQDQATSSTSMQTAAALVPGTGPPPAGIAIALLRTLLAKPNPAAQNADEKLAQESAPPGKPDGAASVP